MQQNSHINYLLKPEIGPFHTQCVCFSYCLYQEYETVHPLKTVRSVF